MFIILQVEAIVTKEFFLNKQICLGLDFHCKYKMLVKETIAIKIVVFLNLKSNLCYHFQWTYKFSYAHIQCTFSMTGKK